MAADRPKAPHTVLVAHPSAELYGSDKMVLESVIGMICAGWRVVVALPSHGPLANLLVQAGARLEILDSPVLRKSALSPQGLLGLGWEAASGFAPAIKLMRRYRVDTVYVSTLTVPLWIAAARAAGRHTVVHVHEAEKHSRVVDTGMASPLLLAHKIIINSEFSASVLTDSIPALKDRIEVVYNGVVGPDSVGEPVVPPRETLDGGLKVAYVGRLSPRKGPQVALAAVRSMRDAGQEVSIDLLGSVFAGYEWFEAELHRDYADLEKAGVVRFHGFTTSIWPTLAACDVAVVPSVLPEPFGNTAVEAGLAARPVVVSAVGGLPEAVAGDRAAQTVTPDDPAALAAALTRVIDTWDTQRADAVACEPDIQRRFAPVRYQMDIVSATVAPTHRVAPHATDCFPTKGNTA